MAGTTERLSGLASGVQTAGVVRAALVVVGGLLLARLLAAGVERALATRATAQQQMVARRLTSYTVIVVALLAALRELGFDLSVLVGAAGILTVAVGFASQTSASNIISGLFLIGERPFELGDFVTVGTTEGEVTSIDLLSVKLRTPDNLLVRIPNETLLKSEIVNQTRYAIRRFDLRLGVAYHSDLDAVKEVLLQAAADDPRVLDEPAPWFVFEGFGESSLDIRLSVWATNQAFFEWRNDFRLRARRALVKADVDIPFPHRTLYAGPQTAPLPVRVVSSDPSATRANDEGGASS